MLQKWADGRHDRRCSELLVFRNLAQAGWIFSSDEDSFWDPDASYSGAFRGSSDAGDGTVSLQLQGEGVVVPWLGVVADLKMVDAGQDQGGGHVTNHELCRLWHSMALSYGSCAYGLSRVV